MQTIIASLLWPDNALPAPVLELSPWLEFEAFPIANVLGRLAAQRHRRFIKTHTPADGVPWLPDAKYVFVARDGRDAFMSMCNHLQRFRDDVREGMNLRAAADGVPPMPGWNGDVHGFFGVWLESAGMLEHLDTFWRRRAQPNVLLVHYGDLKRDLGGEMRRVADFLGIAVSAAQWPAVVERCTFDAMQTRGAEIGAFEALFEGGVRSFIFKGTNGRWRDVLTADEVARYAAKVGAVLPPAGAAWLEQGRAAGDPRHG
jgi:aryl sulfotransferase